MKSNDILEVCMEQMKDFIASQIKTLYMALHNEAPKDGKYEISEREWVVTPAIMSVPLSVRISDTDYKVKAVCFDKEQVSMTLAFDKFEDWEKVSINYLSADNLYKVAHTLELAFLLLKK